MFARSFAATVVVVTLAGTSRADLVLTAQGQAAGFQLALFADQFPNSGGVGPLGIGFVAGGGLMVSDYPGNVRVFPTGANGQHAPAVAVAQNYGFANAVGIAQVGNTFYMSQQSAGNLIQINPNGTFNQVIVTGLPSATGVATNPANGHVFVTTLGNNSIFDVDPIAKTKTLFVNQILDGISFSADGKTLYGAGFGGALNGHILGYDTTTKALVFDSGFIPGGIDGTALGFGSLAGNIYVNTNAGTVVQVNLATLAQTTIASGGSRGDFVTVDPTNGTLLITQTDRIYRLTAPAGGGFGGGGAGAATPEPATLAVFGLLGLGGLVASRRRGPAR